MTTVLSTTGIVQRLDLELEITNAFVWEGSARIYLEESQNKTLKLSIHGTSMCEHDGDLDGIRSQVFGLEGKRTVIDNITYVITSAKITEEAKGNTTEEGQFNVSIKGEVIIKIP